MGFLNIENKISTFSYQLRYAGSSSSQSSIDIHVDWLVLITSRVDPENKIRISTEASGSTGVWEGFGKKIEKK